MIRKLQVKDREQLVAIVENTDNFNSSEKKIAIELIDDSLSNTNNGYYHTFVFENDGKLHGYHCIGKRALTDGVYDLFWIVVNSKEQNQGVGKKLLEHAEEFVRTGKGNWILAETSSKDSYTATRNFYFRNNYSIVAEIKDFYTTNDNLIVFGKYLK